MVRKTLLRTDQSLWAKSLDEAKRTMQKWWPVSALSGRLHVDLPTPKHFEDAVELMGEPEIRGRLDHRAGSGCIFQAIQAMQTNGYDHVYLHQVGPDQEGFWSFTKNRCAFIGAGESNHRFSLIGKVPMFVCLSNSTITIRQSAKQKISNKISIWR